MSCDNILLQNYSDKQLEVDEPMDDMRDDTGPSTSGACRDEDMEVETSLHTPNSQLDASLTMHDYCGITPSFSNIRHQMTQTPYSVEDASTQTDVDLWTSETCIQTDQSCFTFHTDSSTQVDKPVFTYGNIQHSDEKVLFYTGIPTLQHSKHYLMKSKTMQRNRRDVNKNPNLEMQVQTYCNPRQASGGGGDPGDLDHFGLLMNFY